MNLQMKKMTTSDAHPTRMIAIRQPTRPDRKASGVVAENQPIPPTAISAPATLASCAPRNHSPNILIVDTKTAAKPRPTQARAAIAKPKRGARPNPIAPNAATRLKTTIVFFGPHESERMPTGTCIIA